MCNLLGGSYVCWVAAAGGNLTDGVVATVWLIAMLCDLLDGLVARKLGVDGPLGLQLDSLADVVTGGLAPAFVAYRLLIDEDCVFSRILALTPMTRVLPWALAIASAYRLARFNVNASKESDKKYFEGLPAPASSIFWMGMIVWSGGTHSSIESQAILIIGGIGLVFLPIFMILKRKFFSLKDWGDDVHFDNKRKVFVALSILVTACVFFVWHNVFVAAPLSVLLYSCFAFALAPK